MQKGLIVIALFLLQLFVLLKGADTFGAALNPFIFLAIGMALPVYYWWYLLKVNILSIEVKPTKSSGLLGFLLGSCSILACFGLMHKLFKEFPDPYSISDVLLSVETLYNRFIAGIYPYKPLEQYAWHPFPPYLPMYWLPLGISDILQIDTRWTGIIILALAVGYYGAVCWRTQANAPCKILATLLPAIALVGFVQFARADVAVSFEFIIGAYYLLLATGLIGKNLSLIVIGIICCLLSRFTVVFWLPLFAILAWNNLNRKQFYISLAIIIVAVSLIYIVPFHLKDTSAFGKALDYYKGCAIYEWEGMGRDHYSWTFTTGIHFAPYFRHILSGTMEERVASMQLIQLAIMAGLIVIGLWLYSKWTSKINYFDFCLSMLYIIMLLYFMTAPLVFKYYYFTFMMVSAAMCGKLLLTVSSKVPNKL